MNIIYAKMKVDFIFNINVYVCMFNALEIIEKILL